MYTYSTLRIFIMLLITAVFFGVKEMISTPIEKKLICESFIVQIVFKYNLNNSD